MTNDLLADLRERGLIHDSTDQEHLAARLAEGVALPAMARHMLGLMHGRPGARAFRRILTVEAIKPGAGLEVLDRAAEAVRDAEARRDTAPGDWAA